MTIRWGSGLFFSDVSFTSTKKWQLEDDQVYFRFGQFIQDKLKKMVSTWLDHKLLKIF